MLIERRGLTAADLTAIADLERRVVDHDGGRLKLEWGALRSRSGEQVDDLLWSSDGHLLGFLGFYAFGDALELTGMVDPSVRRTGIGSALLSAAISIARARGNTHALLVTPRSTASGAAFAAAHGAKLEHSEHFLILSDAPREHRVDHRNTLRPAIESDATVLSQLLAAAFNEEPRTFRLDRESNAERTWVVDRDGQPIATVRLSRHDNLAGIYGFAVQPELQGRGIGRDVLSRVCTAARADGADTITLEVAVNNDRALDLYLSVGFERRATDDYFELLIAAAM